MKKVLFLFLVFLLMNLEGGCARKEEVRAEREKVKGEEREKKENLPPRIVELYLEPSNPKRGDDVKLNLKVVDRENDPVDIQISWFLNGKKVPEQNSYIFQKNIAKKGDLLYALVRVRDRFGETEKETEKIFIANSPPRIASFQVSPANPTYRDKIKVNYTVEDPDGDECFVRVRWMINDELTENEGDEFIPEKAKPGDEISALLTPFDGELYGEEIRTGKVKIANLSPEFVSLPPTSVPSDGDVLRFKILAKDPEGQKLHYLIEGDVPKKLHINESTGEITWFILDEERGKTYRITVIARDEGGGEARQIFEIFAPPKK